MFNEVIKPPATSNNSFTPKLCYTSDKTFLEFNGSCLEQDKVTFTPVNIVNIYIVYEINKNNPISSYPAVENCLFGAVKITKNSDIDKYKYSGYGIGFDRKGNVSFGNGFSLSVIIFEVDISSSVHANNRTKNILILGEGITQRLDSITLTAEKKCPINFTATKKKFCLSLHYIKSKAKDSEIVANPLCLGNISTDFFLLRTRLYKTFYNFSVDYRTIAVDDILDVHKYLMKKVGIV